jgi:chromosomal replication initiation ATPase DnaA
MTYLPKGWRRTWAQIVADVCKQHMVRERDLFSPCRAGHLLRARQDLYLAARRDTTLSISEIARRTGRHHTTVLNALKYVERRHAA